MCSSQKPAVTLERYQRCMKKRRVQGQDTPSRPTLGHVQESLECVLVQEGKGRGGVGWGCGPRGRHARAAWRWQWGLSAGRDKRSSEAGLELAFYCHTFYDLPLNLTPGTFCSFYQGLKACLKFPRGLRRSRWRDCSWHAAAGMQLAVWGELQYSFRQGGSPRVVRPTWESPCLADGRCGGKGAEGHKCQPSAPLPWVSTEMLPTELLRVPHGIVVRVKKHRPEGREVFNARWWCNSDLVGSDGHPF